MLSGEYFVGAVSRIPRLAMLHCSISRVANLIQSNRQSNPIDPYLDNRQSKVGQSIFWIFWIVFWIVLDCVLDCFGLFWIVFWIFLDCFGLFLIVFWIALDCFWIVFRLFFWIFWIDYSCLRLIFVCIFEFPPWKLQ